MPASFALSGVVVRRGRMQSLIFALFAIFGHDLSYISTDLDPNTKPKYPDYCKEPLLENRTIEKRLDRIVGFANEVFNN